MGCACYLAYLDPGPNDVFRSLFLALFYVSVCYGSLFPTMRWGRASSRCGFTYIHHHVSLSQEKQLSPKMQLVPEKESDWMSLSQVPTAEPITMVRDTPIGQVGEDLRKWK